MNKIILDDGLYYQCNSLEEANKITIELLNKNYKLEKHKELVYKLINDKDIIYISYLNHYQNIKSSKDFIKYEKDFNVIYPNYNNSFLKCLNTYDNLFLNTNKDCDIYLYNLIKNNNIKHIINLVLDGLGTKILNSNLDKTSFLRTHYIKDLTAIYPSTTVAATTSIKANKYPIETGYLGWHNYFKEVNRSLLMFSGIDFYSNDCIKHLDISKRLPYKMFYHDYNIKGYDICPDFTKKDDLNIELNKVSKLLKKDEKNIFYVYNTMPDSNLHMYGNNSIEVKEKIEELDSKLNEFSKTLNKDTLLVITADHGHINCPKVININEFSILTDMLERRIDNEARCMFFKVKNEFLNDFKELFNKIFSYAYKLYTKDEFLKLGFIGESNNIHPYVLECIGDYIAIATKDVIVNYALEDDLHFKSHHAGFTDDEMIVPLICYVGEK